MNWLAEYWWILILLLIGTIFNGIKDLIRLDHKRFLEKKPQHPPQDDQK